MDALVLAEARIEREAAEHPSAATLAAVGVRNLLGQRLEQAVLALESALERNPEDPRILSDLGAAYLVRASHEARPADLVLALHLVRKAVEVEPGFVEARFNLALAVESLFLHEEAKAAWEGYLELDSSTMWSEEARRRLRRLREPTAQERWEKAKEAVIAVAGSRRLSDISEFVRRFPKETRELAEEDLLAAWAEAVLSDEPAGAARNLKSARRIGEALAEANGEHLLLDSIRVVEEARLRSPWDLRALAHAHQLYGRARTLYTDHRNTEAAPLFEEAERGFRRFASPMGAWCSFYRIVSRYREGKLSKALAALDASAADSEYGRHPSLTGRIHWMRGMVLLTLGDPVGSLQAYGTALNIFERANLEADAASVHVLLGESYSYLGDREKAWRHLYRALDTADEVPDPRRLDATLSEAAELLNRGHPELSLLFHHEVVALARAAGVPGPIAHAILRRSRAHLDLGDLDRAREDLAKARRILYRIPDPALRSRVEADLAQAEGELLLAHDPVRAVAPLTRAVEFYAQVRNRFALIPTLLARARSRAASADFADAERDYRRAIAEMERQRASIPFPELQSSFARGTDLLFEEMIRVQIEQGRPDIAFEYAEREKSSSVPGGADLHLREAEGVLAGGWGGGTGNLSNLQAALSPGTVLVKYAVLRERLAVWIVDHEAIRLVEQPVGADRLVSLIAAFREAIREGREPEIMAAGARLYDLLIRSVAPEVDAGATLVLVPDEALHDLPFAALVDRRTGRFLVEDHPLQVSLSAGSVLASEERRSRSAWAPPGPALVIGNPALVREPISDLPALPAAEEEAHRVGKAIQGSTVLVGEGATREAFLNQVGSFSVVHLATHAVTNPEYPELSFLVLTNGEGTLEPLYARELRRLDLSHVRLVVLSACTSLGTEADRRVGVGLTPALLGAGAAAVVGTLWGVEDKTASRLFGLFYAGLGRGEEPVVALRHAQLQMLREQGATDRRVVDWAGFRMTG